MGAGGSSSSTSLIKETLSSIMDATSNATATSEMMSACQNNVVMSGKREDLDGGKIVQECEDVTNMVARLQALSTSKTQSALESKLNNKNTAKGGDPIGFLAGKTSTKSDVQQYIKEVTKSVSSAYSRCGSVARAGNNFDDKTKIKKWHNYGIDQKAVVNNTMNCVADAISQLSSYNKLQDDLKNEGYSDSTLAANLMASLGPLLGLGSIGYAIMACSGLMCFVLLLPIFTTIFGAMSKLFSNGSTHNYAHGDNSGYVNMKEPSGSRNLDEIKLQLNQLQKVLNAET